MRIRFSYGAAAGAAPALRASPLNLNGGCTMSLIASMNESENPVVARFVFRFVDFLQ
jgi:hypothetical protein